MPRPKRALTFDRTAPVGKPLLPGQVSTVLPPDARTLLSNAASVMPGLDPGASPERTRELEQAIQRVRLKYPAYFR